MADIDIAREVARQAVAQQLGPPRPFLSLINQAFDDTSGSQDFFAQFWQHPAGPSIVLVAIAIAPTSAAGVWRADGPNIQSATDGLFFAAGGGYLYLYDVDSVRFFRLRANAGGLGTFSAQAYRRG